MKVPFLPQGKYSNGPGRADFPEPTDSSGILTAWLFYHCDFFATHIVPCGPRRVLSMSAKRHMAYCQPIERIT
jgi:hypothetical protein